MSVRERISVQPVQESGDVVVKGPDCLSDDGCCWSAGLVDDGEQLGHRWRCSAVKEEGADRGEKGVMSVRGVRQLRELVIRYSRVGGSSAGVRELLRSERLREFARENPEVAIVAEVKESRHPVLRGKYLNGIEVEAPLRNFGEKEVLESMGWLRSQSGRENLTKLKRWTKVQTTTPSIQGRWNGQDISAEGFVFHGLEENNGQTKAE